MPASLPMMQPVKLAREIAAEYDLTGGQVPRIMAAHGVIAPPDQRPLALF